jgi:SAM-dependent methyltransferase
MPDSNACIITEERIYNADMPGLIFLLVNLGFALLIFYLTIAFITGAPFVPSAKTVAESIIRLARLKPGMKVYDLGSGEGRLLFMSAGQGAAATGFEINPYLVFYTWVKIRFSPVKNHIRVKLANFWFADIHDADVIFIYLLPWRMQALETVLKNKLKKGAVIVSNSFIFPNLTMIRQDAKNHVYVFRI